MLFFNNIRNIYGLLILNYTTQEPKKSRKIGQQSFCLELLFICQNF